MASSEPSSVFDGREASSSEHKASTSSASSHLASNANGGQNQAADTPAAHPQGEDEGSPHTTPGARDEESSSRNGSARAATTGTYE